MAENETDQSPMEYVSIAILENPIEAQIVESILAEEPLPFRIRSFHDTAYDGLFQFQRGWAELYAPEPYKDKILEILQLVRSQNNEIKDESTDVQKLYFTRLEGGDHTF